jgi:hypothetical protein
MDPFSANCSKLHRFIAEHLGITSVTVLVAFLVMASLAALVVFSDLACSSPTSTTPMPTLTPPPPHERTPMPTPSPAPAATLLPPVTLEEPEDGSYIDWGSEVTLRWSCPYVLEVKNFYRLDVWRKGLSSFPFPPTYHKENCYTLANLSPGIYNWAVATVHSIDRDKPVLLSEESDWFSFEIAPPTPVVHSVSPTSTVRGTIVLMTVTGENLTPSLVITIGDVALRTTPVNSSMITASVPVTLEVGEHRVGVKDSTGKGIWSGSFTVVEPPMPTPSVTRTPRPPAYPPPVLAAVDMFGCSLTFHWSWARQLAEDEYFGLRVGIGAPGESRTWTKETQCMLMITEPGEYVWEVAICRGDPEVHICNQLAVSEQVSFSFMGCGKDRP